MKDYYVNKADLICQQRRFITKAVLLPFVDRERITTKATLIQFVSRRRITTKAILIQFASRDRLSFEFQFLVTVQKVQNQNIVLVPDQNSGIHNQNHLNSLI
jgi:hypothetical protein